MNNWQRNKYIYITSKEQNSSSNNLNIRDYIILGIAVLIFFLFARSMNRFANYPEFLFVLIGIPILCIFFIIFLIDLVKHWKENLDLIDKLVSMLGFIIKSITVTFFFTCTILLLFNYYNKNVSMNNPEEIIPCKINSIHIPTRSGRFDIWYLYKGNLNLLGTNRNIETDIISQKKYDNYKLFLTVRPGLLGSYIIIDWNIQKIR